MRRRLGWMALVAVLTVPAALAWAGEGKAAAAPAHQDCDDSAPCCCCSHQACPTK